MVHPHHLGKAGRSSSSLTTPLSALRQLIPRGNSFDSRHSSIPAPAHQETHEPPSVNSRWTLGHSPRRNEQSLSASQLRSESPLNSPHRETNPPQYSQHQATYLPPSHQQTSLYPPTPPPKDDWRSEPTQSTVVPNPSFPYEPQTPSPLPSPRFPLPPIRTNISTIPSARERAEQRKSRQMEIEHGISRAESHGGKRSSVSAGGIESHDVDRDVGTSEKESVGKIDDRRDSSDSEVVMSSTSYPRMEWQPREFSKWDGH